MRPPDHRSLDQVGVTQQDFFDLTRVDVAAAADDHVLRAVSQREQPVFVHATEITGMEPAAAQRFGIGFNVVPIPIHYAIAAGHHLADFARRHVVVITVS